MNAIPAWVRAARPKTLPAAAVPVMVGGALAHAGASFILEPWAICLVFALLIQIGTNFANDYYDFLKGADDHRRIGPSRAVASGWISPKAMRNGMIVVFAAAFLSGCLLIPWGGSWLLLVGVVSILCGVAYTGGPYPLGYNGWGDVFVFIFFGWVATGITYYVQAGTFSVSLPTASGLYWNLLAGMVPGALATNLLVVNNVRDEPLDREAGKHPLAVRFGRAFGRAQYAVLLVLALAVPLAFAVLAGMRGCLLVLLAVPLAVLAWRRLVSATDRATYDIALGLTALLLIVVGGLFSLGLLL
jgi:1,4-dihydroxy-2-naphthoate octaprenyltransferase